MNEMNSNKNAFGEFSTINELVKALEELDEKQKEVIIKTPPIVSIILMVQLEIKRKAFSIKKKEEVISLLDDIISVLKYYGGNETVNMIEEMVNLLK